MEFENVMEAFAKIRSVEFSPQYLNDQKDFYDRMSQFQERLLTERQDDIESLSALARYNMVQVKNFCKIRQLVEEWVNRQRAKP